MPAPGSPPWGRGQAFRRGPDYVNLNERVSDADRSEVADSLSRHYGAGRLDQAEFEQRLDQAMNAKTRADLSGLLDDLPADGEQKAVPARRHGGPVYQRVLFLILLAVLAAAAWHAVMRFWAPWLLIALFAVLWLRHGPWHRRQS